MKWGRNARLLEEGARLFTDLHPFLIGLFVGPLVQQAPTRREHSVRFTQNGTPICREVQKARDDDDVELPGQERKSAAFTNSDANRQPTRLGSQFLNHTYGRLERDNIAPKLGKGDRHTTRAGANIKDVGALLDRRRGGEAVRHVFSQNGPMPPVVDPGVTGKIDAF